MEQCFRNAGTFGSSATVHIYESRLSGSEPRVLASARFGLINTATMEAHAARPQRHLHHRKRIQPEFVDKRHQLRAASHALRCIPFKESLRPCQLSSDARRGAIIYPCEPSSKKVFRLTESDEDYVLCFPERLFEMYTISEKMFGVAIGNRVARFSKDVNCAIDVGSQTTNNPSILLEFICS